MLTRIGRRLGKAGMLMDIASGHADGREAAGGDGGDGGDGGRAARTTTGRYRHGTNIHEVAAGCWNIDSVRLFFYTADLASRCWADIGRFSICISILRMQGRKIVNNSLGNQSV